MAKILKVTEPFFTLGVGDTLEYSKEGNKYVTSVRETFGNSSCNGNDYSGSYSASFELSADYAEKLIEHGFLQEETESLKNPFKNVFDEIDELLNKYTDEQINLEEDCATMPPCLKLEKATVLDNLITLLKHLKSLKKN